MTESILAIVASVLGIVAMWLAKKWIVPWLQRYYTGKQIREAEQARREAQERNQREQAESDRMRDIDGRSK